MNRILKFAGVATAAIFALTGAGCASVSTHPAERAVHVSGGFIIPADQKIEDCVDTSKVAYAPAGHDFYVYPAGERTYKFSTAQGSDGGAVTIVKDNIEMEVSGVVTFSLNGDCETLKQFHALIGSKLWNGKPAYVNDEKYEGWDTMLDTYMEQSIQSAATAAAAQVKASSTEIYNGAGRAELEDAMTKLIPTYIKSLSRGDFFTGIGLVVNKPTIARQDVRDALASKTVAQMQNEAQVERNKAVATEMQSIEQLISVLGKDGYIAYTQNKLTQAQIDLLSKAIEQGKVQILPVPTGTGVTLPVGK